MLRYQPRFRIFVAASAATPFRPREILPKMACAAKPGCSMKAYSFCYFALKRDCSLPIIFLPACQSRTRASASASAQEFIRVRWYHWPRRWRGPPLPRRDIASCACYFRAFYVVAATPCSISAYTAEQISAIFTLVLSGWWLLIALLLRCLYIDVEESRRTHDFHAHTLMIRI